GESVPSPQARTRRGERFWFYERFSPDEKCHHAVYEPKARARILQARIFSLIKFVNHRRERTLMTHANPLSTHHIHLERQSASP
ncbi:MAG TPA: hypothetical protein VH370_13635, partial [Humisphaera sp.]|nr:hypothetical protein [Humisphaera sp.]